MTSHSQWQRVLPALTGLSCVSKHGRSQCDPLGDPRDQSAPTVEDWPHTLYPSHPPPLPRVLQMHTSLRESPVDKFIHILFTQIHTHTHIHTCIYKFCTNVWWPWGSLKVLIITHNISQTLWNRSQPVYLIGQLLPGFLIVTKTKVKLLLLFIHSTKI